MAALLVVLVAWLALEPWRPQLTGDDWGYYDSVMRTLVEGRPVVSDWLAPATVGLSLPAALVTRALGDPWSGSMLTEGAFGLLGLLALAALCARFAVPAPRTALALVALAFFPIYLSKWTHFESSVPAFALALAALVLYCDGRAGDRPLALLAGGLCVAWAVAIRQNHVLVAGVGALGLLAPARRRDLFLWVAPSLLALAVLRFGLEPSFAQLYAVPQRLAQGLAPEPALSVFVRALFFSCGMATLLAVLCAPGAVLARWRAMRPAQWLAGVAGLALLLAYAAWRGKPWTWLVPETDVVLLIPEFGLTFALVVLGGLTWSSYLPRRGEPLARRLALLLVPAYLALASVWGFTEYYLLEPAALLFVADVLATAGEDAAEPRGRRRLFTMTAALLFALTGWYVQRLYNDFQSAQLAAVEHALRAGLAQPGEMERAALPFGLAAWNMLPAQIERWQARGTGDPLAFWELFSRQPSVVFLWSCPAAAPGTVLARGTAPVALRDTCWMLVRTGPDAGNVFVPHRYLPLTPREWQDYVARGGRSP